jgi:5-methylcytosine-specific restriction endonuclease McrA
MANISKRIRRRIYRNSKNRCKYCRKQVKTKLLTLDHKQPKSKGGKNGQKNLACCCFECNQRKGAMSEAEFLEWVKSQRSET